MKKERKKLFRRPAPTKVDATATDADEPTSPRLVVLPSTALANDSATTATTATATAPTPGGTARAVETMLKEFSGGESAVPAVRSGGRPSGMYDQLWQLSMADPHTGLANQLLLLDRLTQALARLRRHGGEVVVCHIDLDNLGEINLDLGYTTGNTVLCEIARRLTTTLRTEDTVGRVGGSELVVVLAISDESDVGPLMRRLQHALEEPVEVGGQRIRVHASMGVVLAEDGESAEAVLARADRSTRVANR